MERRLLEAAQKGNIDELNDLIRSNALVLKEMALEGAGHTPLHVACVAGHVDVVRELLKLMPKFVEKVNAVGFSPLHIAAAQGDVEVVRELLRVGRHLCSVKGRERRIPLHYAVMNGELHVMKLLLSAWPESTEETTAREETALHLAVKNNRFEAVVVLVEHLKHNKKEQVINWKDHKGNTALHLAAAGKNFEVVDFMLCGHALEFGIVEVNALNKSGSTPLDVSSRSDREIREILMRAGAKHGQSNLPSSQIVRVDGDGDNIEGATSYQSVVKRAVENDHPPLSLSKDSNQGRRSSGDIRSDLLVVAVLIASATYQAVLQPPTFLKKVEMDTKQGFLASYSYFLTSTTGRNLALLSFLSSNTFGFLLSVQTIIGLTKDRPLKLPLMLSTFAMVWTYLSCMVNVPSRSLLDENFSLLGAALIGTLAILIPVVLLLIQIKIARYLGKGIEFLSQINILCPVDPLPPKSGQTNPNSMQRPNSC
ncbi:ankyrin repeat-containing protein BDA1-like [Syzygium oleosum]|uniref:ankyrin repeat-containing protein BDA1-like n=1 Tax=Syzygium oleosum TaxID=219896 RepID=UPI0024BB0607|nr:ankyrin repeat-containing protein BDA1-like [Syzygium oleosum]